MRKTCFLQRATLQPFPMIIGLSLSSIISSYVVIYGRPILLESPLRAIKVDFKVHYALDCSYLIQSQRMWVVLAAAIFNIKELSFQKLLTLSEVARLVKVLSV